jgi:sugar lactone lactonase YvrE
MRIRRRAVLLPLLSLLLLPLAWRAHAQSPTAEPERIAELFGPIPTGVTVAPGGRIFVCFPRWGDAVEYSVAELVDGVPRPYPNERINRFDPEHPARHFVSVQSVVVDPRGWLWAVDTGSIQFGPVIRGGAKLVAIDLATDRVVRTIRFPENVVLPTTYLNDIRFDLRHGRAGVAYITDSANGGPNGIIVVDLASGRSWRRLHDHPSTRAEPGFTAHVEGRPLVLDLPGAPPAPLRVGSDGIALSADGKRLYYSPLSGRELHSVSTAALRNRRASDAEVAASVRAEGKPVASDGLESDAQGRVYATDYEHEAIVRRAADGSYETLAQDPSMLWPDTLSLADDGYLYFTANQVHRSPEYNDGRDLRQQPYLVLRVPVDATPVRLRRY